MLSQLNGGNHGETMLILAVGKLYKPILGSH
jgi:hypothetical protein